MADSEKTAETQETDDAPVVVDGTNPENVLEAVPATALAKFDPAEALLQKMEAELADYVPDFSTKAGEKKAREYRSSLVKLRAGAENLRKKIQAPWLEAQRSMKDKVEDITKRVTKFEEPIDKAIKELEAQRAAEAARLADLERQAEAKRQERIAAIRDLPAQAAGFTSSEISEVVEDLGAIDVSEERFGPHVESTLVLIVQVRDRLLGMRDTAKQREDREAELQAERDRLENERIANERLEQERQQQEQERIEAARIEQALNDLRMLPLKAMDPGVTSAEVRKMIDERATPTPQLFGNRLGEALDAFTSSGQQLAMMLQLKRKAEEAAAPAPAPAVEPEPFELAHSPAEDAAAAPAAEAPAPIEEPAQAPDPQQDDAFPGELHAARVDADAAAAERRSSYRELTAAERALREQEEIDAAIGSANFDAAQDRVDAAVPPSDAKSDGAEQVQAAPLADTALAGEEPQAAEDASASTSADATAAGPALDAVADDTESPSVRVFKTVREFTGMDSASTLQLLRELDFEDIQLFIASEEIPL